MGIVRCVTGSAGSAMTQGASTMAEEEPTRPVHEGRVTRRQVLTRLGAAGAAVALAPSVLAACGGDNSGGSSATTASGGSAATTASGGAATTASGGGAATTA